MKSFKHTLFIVLIIAMGLFVIAHAIFSKKPTAETPIVETPSVSTLSDGRYCYSYNNEENDVPYKVTELINIAIESGEVIGTKTGTQNGPGMTNGYFGTLIGQINDGAINAVFAYIIEGSQNKEREVYTVTDTGLNKLRYPLIETTDGLSPDMTKDFTVLNYTKIQCE